MAGLAAINGPRHGGLTRQVLERQHPTAAEVFGAVRDQFPVTEGHTLIIPKRHVGDYFGLWQPELNAVNILLAKLRVRIDAEDPTVCGFNVGRFSPGASTGRTSSVPYLAL